MGGTTEGGRGSFRGKGRHGRSVQGRGIVAGVRENSIGSRRGGWVVGWLERNESRACLGTKCLFCLSSNFPQITVHCFFKVIGFLFNRCESIYY